MPFTFSHPSIVLPFNLLRKKRLSLTALVIGSLTPDFEYFIRMKEFTMYSHTWIGIFWFDLPLAVLLTLTFNLLVRKKLIGYCPEFLSQRLYRFRDYKKIESHKLSSFAIIVSFITGITSHLILDKLTHKTVHYINKIPTLQDQQHHSGYRQITYFLLWDLASFIGMLVVLYGIWQLKPMRVTNRKTNLYPFWLVVIVLAAIVIISRFFFFGDFSIPNLIVCSISSFLLAIVIVCPFFNDPYQAHL